MKRIGIMIEIPLAMPPHLCFAGACLMLAVVALHAVDLANEVPTSGTW
jgi:hypothetical protein